MKPRYSVYRIERAKQRALTGSSFKLQKGSKGRFVIDWCGEDEEELHKIIAGWDEKTGHQGLNELIDFHEFSHGTNYTNATLSKLLQVQMSDGRMNFKDNNRYAWMPKQEQW